MFCSACGYKLPENALFCPECGKKTIMNQTEENNKSVDQSVANYQHKRTPGILVFEPKKYVLEIASLYALVLWAVCMVWGYFLSPLHEYTVSGNMMYTIFSIVLNFTFLVALVFSSFYSKKDNGKVLFGTTLAYIVYFILSSIVSFIIIYTTNDSDFLNLIFSIVSGNIFNILLIISIVMLRKNKKYCKYFFITVCAILIICSLISFFGNINRIDNPVDFYYINGHLLSDQEKTQAYVDQVFYSIPTWQILLLVMGLSLKFKTVNCNIDNNMSVIKCVEKEDERAFTENQSHKNSYECYAKKKYGKGIIAISVVAVILCVSIVLIDYNKIFQRMNFDFDFNEEKIETFLEIVCENVDAEYAEVDDVHLNDYGDSYYAYIDIKLDGYTEEEIQVRIDNEEDRDEVSKLIVTFYDSVSKNELNCIIELCKAIEITVCGKSVIDDYFDGFYFKYDYEWCDYPLLIDEVWCRLTSSTGAASFVLYRV